jgi:2-polyprenyl-3-methyl-5-hydroxy-6-metoxy-1,4-benzoquinol methylase
MINKHNNTESVSILDQYYKAVDTSGYPLFAYPGLHEFILNKILNLKQRNSKILELGAGSGYLSNKLSNEGYDVTALDLVSDNFRPIDSVKFICADLNDRFDKLLGNNTYDIILAVELIEHLENPRDFIRKCRCLLKDDGILIVTTPNIENPISKAMYLKYGTFQWFTDNDYHKEGHIMPVSSWLLKKVATEANLMIEQLESYGNAYRFTTKLHKIITAKLIEYFLCDKRLCGEILVISCRLAR